MKYKMVAAPLLALMACSVQASLVWQPAPPEKTAQRAAGAHAGHGGRGGGTAFILRRDGDGAVQADLWLPTRVRRPLPLSPTGRVLVQGTGINSFHMLFAKRVQGRSEEVAMRYLYLQGKPIDLSPAELVDASKTVLDILPAPLTREHQRYLGNKPASFLVRYRGRALALHPVTLTTSNGSAVHGTTDERGRVVIELPDDFANVQAGRRNNRPAEFVVAVAVEADDRHYHTTVSAPYYVSPSQWQSFSGGLMAMFAGVVSGLVVLRRSTRSTKANAGEA